MEACVDDDRPGRLADDGVPDARTAGRSTPARTSRPSRVTGCRPSRSSCWRSRRRGGPARRPRGAGGAARRRARAARPRLEPGDEPLTADAPRRGRARRSPAPTSRVRRLRRRAEVPARLDARAPAAPRQATRRSGWSRRPSTAWPRGGMYDRRRRRLPPLLGRRALARPALREDALRQRAARLRVPARLGRDRRAALPARSSRRRSTTWCASCACRAAASPRRRTPTRTASRASRSPGRRTEGRAGRTAAAVRARALDHPR